jgi:hypothetical protein
MQIHLIEDESYFLIGLYFVILRNYKLFLFAVFVILKKMQCTNKKIANYWKKIL